MAGRNSKISALRPVTSLLANRESRLNAIQDLLKAHQCILEANRNLLEANASLLDADQGGLSVNIEALRENQVYLESICEKLEQRKRANMEKLRSSASSSAAKNIIQARVDASRSLLKTNRSVMKTNDKLLEQSENLLKTIKARAQINNERLAAIERQLERFESRTEPTDINIERYCPHEKWGEWRPIPRRSQLQWALRIRDQNLQTPILCKIIPTIIKS